MRKEIYRHEGTLSIDDVKHYINRYELEDKPRLRTMYNYYIGDHDILRKKYEPHKPDARIVHNFASYISNTATSYFMGTPISYASEDDNTMKEIQKILDYNDEADKNAIHAEYMSIYGRSYELIYVDKDSRIDTRFAVVSPEEIIVIYDYALEPKITAAIRYYYDNDNKLFVELYDSENVTYLEGDKDSISIIDTVRHHFKDVPVVEYVNNNTRQGDYEPVIGLIDEYNEINSTTANDFAYFSDAYLFLAGASMDEDEASNMKENKIIMSDDPQAKAEFLIKNINDVALENYKKRIEKDIHKFSAIPNMSDESFASNLSGVAIKYKILGLENMAAMKERKFKKGLQRRFKLMYNLLFTRGKTNVDYLDVQPTFKRSLPSNLLDEAEVVTKLQGIISDETLMNMLSLVEDPAVEKQQIKDEQSERTPFIDRAYADEEEYITH